MRGSEGKKVGTCNGGTRGVSSIRETGGLLNFTLAPSCKGRIAHLWRSDGFWVPSTFLYFSVLAMPFDQGNLWVADDQWVDAPNFQTSVDRLDQGR